MMIGHSIRPNNNGVFAGSFLARVLPFHGVLLSQVSFAWVSDELYAAKWDLRHDVLPCFTELLLMVE